MLTTGSRSETKAAKLKGAEWFGETESTRGQVHPAKGDSIKAKARTSVIKSRWERCEPAR